VTFGIGAVLLAKQAGIFLQPPPAPNDTLIWVGFILVTGTGVAQVLAWRFGGGAAGSTMEPASSSSAVAPSLPLPLPSANGGDGEQRRA
jgi:hypothetical protein